MKHLFLLVVFLGEGKAPISNNMYFYDIDKCNYFASQLVKRYGNYNGYASVPNEHKAIAYCKPIYIDPEKIGIQVY